MEAVGLGLIAGSWDLKNSNAGSSGRQARALTDATILAADATAAGRRSRRSGDQGGHSLARRLGMLPGNVCTPEYLANTARDIAKRLGMLTTTLNREAMAREKMGSFLSVAQGTTQEPLLIMLQYQRGPKDAKPVVLVGKGLCFDSGGISIKPAQGMDWMKFDMCGRPACSGAMEAIGLELPINVVGLIGATTNMPSGEAVKPVTWCRRRTESSSKGSSTRTEGRLVLADVLVFAKAVPTAVVDAATGACVIALGHTATGSRERRWIGAGSPGRRQAVGGTRMAIAALGGLQRVDQVRHRRH